MSDQVATVSDQDQDGSAVSGLSNESNQGGVSIETHKRLLSQRKKDQERIRELEAFQENVDLEKKELEGKKDEVILGLKQALDSERGKTNSLIDNVKRKTIRNEVSKRALMKGLRKDRLDKFLKLTEDTFFGREDLPFEVDNEKFEITNEEAFNSLLEKEVEENSDWFTKTTTEPNDVIPENRPTSTGDKKLSEKSVDELAEML